MKSTSYAVRFCDKCRSVGLFPDGYEYTGAIHKGVWDWVRVKVIPGEYMQQLIKKCHRCWQVRVNRFLVLGNLLHKLGIGIKW